MPDADGDAVLDVEHGIAGDAGLDQPAEEHVLELGLGGARFTAYSTPLDTVTAGRKSVTRLAWGTKDHWATTPPSMRLLKSTTRAPAKLSRLADVADLQHADVGLALECV